MTASVESVESGADLVTATFSDIRYEVDDPVAVVTLNRPSRMNAFTHETQRELREALALAMEDRHVVGAIITGEGEAFCAGLDVEVLAATLDDPPDLSAIPASEQALFSYIRDLPKPVIAAVNGMCAGGGLVLALMCDLRVVSEEAVFTTVFSRRGLVAEHGATWLLPRLVGTGRALDLLWSSRRVAATEAAAIGLADLVAGPGKSAATAAIAYVQELAKSTSPRSLQATKRLVNAHWATSFEDAARDALLATSEILSTPDPEEGVRSYLERRAPIFGRIGDA